MAADRPPPIWGDPPLPDAGGGLGGPPLGPAVAAPADRPPAFSFATVAAVLLFTSGCFWFGGEAEIIGILDTGREVDFNTTGYLSGCFLSIGTLTLFLKADHRARARRRFNDWPIGARKLTGWVTFASWFAGAAHLYFWALDLTRP